MQASCEIFPLAAVLSLFTFSPLQKIYRIVPLLESQAVVRPPIDGRYILVVHVTPSPKGTAHSL